MGAEVAPPDELWQYDYMLRRAEKKCGEAQARSALQLAALSKPHIKTFVAAVEDHRALAKRPQKRRDKISSLNYDELKTQVADGVVSSYALKQWGETATDVDLERAALDVLHETDARKLRKYLHIFRNRRFPLAHEPLMALVDGTNEQLARSALAALAPSHHPTIRALAYRLMETPGRRGDVMELLINNYQDGDYALFHALIAKDLSDEELHGLGFDVPTFYKARPDADAVVPLLLALYEKDPCSICREHFVELLYSLNALPDWMREECKYDANTYLRVKAEKY